MLLFYISKGVRLFSVSTSIQSATLKNSGPSDHHLNFVWRKRKMKPSKEGNSRRDFLGQAGAATAAWTILPRHVIGHGITAPSDKLNIAGIGVGGMGKENMGGCEAENIVALCDVDYDYAADTFKKYSMARTYKDYRVMLEKQKEIDAVVVATPDHTHAVIALAAMQLGKHVYVQKPLTHSVLEARRLTEAAHQYKAVSQMGNLAVRFPNRLLLWDGEKMEIANDKDANAYVRQPYREGWSL
jgi:hypothetical protein